MRRIALATLVACTIAGTAAATATPAGASPTAPLWVKHVLKYPGGSYLVVRDMSRYPRLGDHLRISIGTREENARVIELHVRQELET